MSTQKSTIQSPTELQEEAVKILEDFNDPLEPFSTSDAKDTLLNIYHDMYTHYEETVFHDEDCFSLYKIHKLLQRIEKWQAKSAIWNVTREGNKG